MTAPDKSYSLNRDMKKKTAVKKKTVINPFDFSGWNFIIFLTLAFVLVVVVALAMGDTATELRAKAGLSCPIIKELPRPEDCPGGEWKFRRGENGCQAFFCEFGK